MKYLLKKSSLSKQERCSNQIIGRKRKQHWSILADHPQLQTEGPDEDEVCERGRGEKRKQKVGVEQHDNVFLCAMRDEISPLSLSYHSNGNRWPHRQLAGHPLS